VIKLPRTNNSQEAYNRRLKEIFPKHAGFYTFLVCLGKEDMAIARDIRRLGVGKKIREPKKKKFIVRDKYFRTLIKRQNLSLEGFLRKISKKLTM
jgi:hypothetical protein